MHRDGRARRKYMKSQTIYSLLQFSTQATLLAVLLVISVLGSTEALRTTDFAASFTDNLVLQRAPSRAVVYGDLHEDEVLEDLYVILAVEGYPQMNGANPSRNRKDVPQTSTFTSVEPEVIQNSNGRTWRATLPPQRPQGGGNFQLTLVTSTAGNLTLHNITFGDVWICAGQSNMALVLKNTYSRDFAAQSLNDTDIVGSDGGNLRMLAVTEMNTWTRWAAEEPNYILRTKPLSAGWVTLQGTPRAHLEEFSSTCIYFGIRLRKYLSKSESVKDKNVPIGLIHTSIGGTMVQSWTPADKLGACQDISYPEDKQAKLYNGLVAPFINTTIKGHIWYQGENNVFETAGSIEQKRGYACALQVMINSWRETWSLKPDTTSPDHPFGVFTLAAGTDEGHPEYMAPFRYAQMSVAAFLPNVFLAHGHDLGDPWTDAKACVSAGCCAPDPNQWHNFVPANHCISGIPKNLPSYWHEDIDGAWLYGGSEVYMGLIHPRNKQRLVERAVLAGLHTAYPTLLKLPGQVTSPKVSHCQWRLDASNRVLVLDLESLEDDDDLFLESENDRVLSSANIEFCVGNQTLCECRSWRLRQKDYSKISGELPEWFCDDHLQIPNPHDITLPSRPAAESWQVDKFLYSLSLEREYTLPTQIISQEFNLDPPTKSLWHAAEDLLKGDQHGSFKLQVPFSISGEVYAVRVAWSSDPCCGNSAARRGGLVPCFLNCGIYTSQHRLPLAPSFVSCSSSSVHKLDAILNPS